MIGVRSAGADDGTRESLVSAKTVREELRDVLAAHCERAGPSRGLKPRLLKKRGSARLKAAPGYRGVLFGASGVLRGAHRVPPGRGGGIWGFFPRTEVLG